MLRQRLQTAHHKHTSSVDVTLPGGFRAVPSELNHGPETPCSEGRPSVCLLVGWLVGSFTSQQHVSVSQGRIYSDMFTYCHIEIGIAD